MIPVISDPRSSWLESPRWDFVWILNGLWLLPLILLSLAVGQSSFFLWASSGAMLLTLWGGHILSPIVTAWSSAPLRQSMMTHPTKYLWMPLLVLVASVLAAMLGLHWSKTWLPSSIGQHFDFHILLVYTFLVWNTWHFCGQHFGVLSIYRIRAQEFSAQVRRLDRWFCVVQICVLLPIAWYTQSQRLGPLFQYLPVPPSGATLARTVALVSGLLSVAVLVAESQRNTRSWPRLAYLLTIGLQPVLATVSYPLFNMALFTASHWIIALALSGRILTGLSSRAQVRHPRRWWRFHGIMAAFAAASVCMYAVFWHPWLIGEGKYLFTEAFLREPVIAVAHASATLPGALLAGLYFGITFVHFLYDRYVYAFRRPAIREGIAPHLFAPLLDKPRRRRTALSNQRERASAIH